MHNCFCFVVFSMATVRSELHSNFRLRVSTVALRLLAKFTPNQAIYWVFFVLAWSACSWCQSLLFYAQEDNNIKSFIRTDLHTSISVSSGSDFKGLFLDSCSHHKLQAITSSLVLECSFLLTLSSHCSFQH